VAAVGSSGRWKVEIGMTLSLATGRPERRKVRQDKAKANADPMTIAVRMRGKATALQLLKNVFSMRASLAREMSAHPEARP
jgi:hypothetical protein